MLSGAERGAESRLFHRVAAHLYQLHSFSHSFSDEDFQALKSIYVGGAQTETAPLINQHFKEQAGDFYYGALMGSAAQPERALADYLHVAQGDHTTFLLSLLEEDHRDALTFEVCRHLASGETSEHGPLILENRILAGILLDSSPERMVELAAVLWSAPTSQHCVDLASHVIDSIRFSGENLEALERAVNSVVTMEQRVELSDVIFAGYPFRQLLTDACAGTETLRRENSRFLLWYLEQSYGEAFLPNQMRTLLTSEDSSISETWSIIREIARDAPK
jgi:hypothetical protein